MVALSGRILLAEDGEDNQRLISFHLMKAGARVEIARNGRIALEMLEQAVVKGRPFDLLVSDMQMPEMDGYTLARRLRVQGSRIPIVALTAHAMTGDRQKCLDAGCNGYATKPINKAALIATCRQWMENAGNAVATPASAYSNKLPACAEQASWQLAATVAPAGSDAASQSGCTNSGGTGVLVSELADDPDMSQLVNEFLSDLGPKVRGMTESLSANRLDELAKLAHQLKGAGGGYGFPTISDAARQVEQLAKAEPDLEQIHLAVGELNRICQQAIAGGALASLRPETENSILTRSASEGMR